MTGEDLCRAYALAREYAYTAVMAPAAGTILSALAEMAEAVGHGRADAREALRVAVEAGAPAVERTREANPMNRAAGVVDAGARGLWLLLDGALAGAEGRSVDESVAQVVARPVAVAAHEVPADVASWAGAYDVQFLVERPSRAAEDLRADMLEFGADCVIVVGDEDAVKVHVHTREPDQIVRIGMTAGRLGDVVVEDLEAMAAEHARATGISVAAPPVPKERTACGVVAVVPGPGFERIVISLGGTPLRGGATMNPSTEMLLEAIRKANADHVVVLPNDRNVIAAAEQAAKLAEDQKVTVVPTRSVPHGMSALVAFDPDGEGPAVARAMGEAAKGAHAIELTRAVRASHVDGQDVRAGEAIALLDGRLVAHGDDELAVLRDAAVQVARVELLTLYVGDKVEPARVAAAKDALREARGDVEVEVVDGGQPHYPFLVAAE
jgi:hypothetical protein